MNKSAAAQRLIDKLTVPMVAGGFAGWTAAFGLLYFLVGTVFQADSHLAYSSNGARADGPGTAIYFSVVTVATLGYGDIVPTGWLRVAACIQVLGGLVFAGLLVSTITVIPSSPARLAKRFFVGFWIEKVRYSTVPGDSYYVSLRSRETNGILTYEETEFGPGTARHGQHYYGVLLANEFPSLVFEYRSEVAVDYSQGMQRILVDKSADKMGRFTSHCIDETFGRTDDIEGRRVDDEAALARLDDPNSYEAEMRAQIQRLFNDDLRHIPSKPARGI